MEDTSESFGDALRTFRQRIEMTQEQLAERAGLSINAVSALERGERRRPYRQTVHTLAAALGLDADEAAALEELLPPPARPADEPDEPSTRPLPAPHQLPPVIANFTGRADDLARLDALLEAGEDDARAVIISAIGGTAGVGKTTLAVTWAHRVRDRFPDGQFYVNLRGYDPGQPASPGDVLEGFLRALDVPVDKIPPSVEQRSALFRSMVDGRRVLVLLDNANSADQVRPLLPGSSSVVVVTSRASLTGLAVSSGAVRLSLGLLSPADAVALLCAVIGERRCAAEPAAVEQLARLCARLPLALQLGGQRAAADPGLPLADLVAELADESERLEVLSLGADEPTAVRAVFSWSYRHLPEPQARLFRLLGAHPGPDIGADAVAALAGVTPARARQLLHSLLDAHLVEPAGAGRFRMHDLLTAYARELADGEDLTADLRRLTGFYLHATAAAEEGLHPGRRRAVVDAAPAPAHPIVFGGYDEAMRWCERELPNLVAIVRMAERIGLPAATWQLPNNLWSFLYVAKHYPEWLETFGAGLAAAERLADSAGRARMLSGLATAHLLTQRTSGVVELFEQASALFRDVGDRIGEGSVHVNVGTTCLKLGRHDEALDHGRRALAIFRSIGHEYAEAAAMCNIGEAHLAVDAYAEAVESFGEVLDLCRRIGHRAGEGLTLVHLGHGYLGLGRYDEAIAHLTEGLELSRANNDRHAVALALTHLGQVHRATDDHDGARRCWLRAVELFAELDDARADELRDELATLDDAPPGGTGTVVSMAARTGPGALTPAERRTAGLAARGLTNREIARTVYLSPKTVEVNLSRAYRKLGVRNRTELANMLAQDDDATPSEASAGP